MQCVEQVIGICVVQRTWCLNRAVPQGQRTVTGECQGQFLWGGKSHRGLQTAWISRKLEAAGGKHEFSLNLFWRWTVLAIHHSVAPFHQFPNARFGSCWRHGGKMQRKQCEIKTEKLWRGKTNSGSVLMQLLPSQKKTYPSPLPTPRLVCTNGKFCLHSSANCMFRKFSSHCLQ